MPSRQTTSAAAAAAPLALALAAGAFLPGTPDPAINSPAGISGGTIPAVRAAAVDPDQQAWLEEHNPFGLPQAARPGSRTLIIRKGYTLSHNNTDLIADWVSYRLTRDYVDGPEKRPGESAFKPDPLLPEGQRAERSDYEGFKDVYDRGHQCASGDSKGRGDAVIKESFFLSNMTPQDSKLNQHRWRLLEARIQDLARRCEELWVITGPAFVDDDGDGFIEYFQIGTNQVVVPTHYFKIVYTRTTSDPDVLAAMAFLVPNKPMDQPFEHYLVSIDQLEEITGCDFLDDYPDEVTLESASATAVWTTAP